MNKEMSRQKAIQQLKKIASHPKKKAEKESIVLSLFFASKEWKEAETIALVRPLDFEFDTNKIAKKAFAQGKRVVVPKSLPNRRLAFYEVHAASQYVVTKFGVEEPVSELLIEKTAIDLIVVPGLLFSSEGYRIGFGGGFYDRYLADYEGQTCSMVFAEQINNNWEVDAFDIPVGHIYTDFVKEVEVEK